MVVPTRNRHAYMSKSLNVDELKGSEGEVSKDRSAAFDSFCLHSWKKVRVYVCYPPACTESMRWIMVSPFLLARRTSPASVFIAGAYVYAPAMKTEQALLLIIPRSSTKIRQEIFDIIIHKHNKIFSIKQIKN